MKTSVPEKQEVTSEVLGLNLIQTCSSLSDWYKRHSWVRCCHPIIIYSLNFTSSKQINPANFSAFKKSMRKSFLRGSSHIHEVLQFISLSILLLFKSSSEFAIKCNDIEINGIRIRERS